MDPYTEQLIERTRKRREMLNARLGKGPEPAPRKRVLEDSTNTSNSVQAIDDDSPKRQCLWEADKGFKPDTPAIHGVKSRLNNLSDNRLDWSDTQDEDRPVQTRMQVDAERSPAKSPASRKSRFAQLAQNLDDFECDMSHPSLKKQEEKKPKWQPPKKDDDRPPHSDAKDRHVSSPRKEYESYQGPKRNTNNTNTNFPPSPKKTKAPPPPAAPPVPKDLGPPKPARCPSPIRSEGLPSSPKKSTHTIQLQQQQQPQTPGSPRFIHQIKKVNNQTPINSKPNEGRQQDDDPAAKPVADRMATWKKTVDTPNKPKVDDPSQLPLSERFAGWEQRVSQTPKTETPARSRIPSTPKQISTPARETTDQRQSGEVSDDPANKPVSDIRATWKKNDAIANPPKSAEPTAYSVSNRMSAWEHMTSSNKVSSIKKIDPGNSPSRPVSGLKPSGTPGKTAPPKPGLTPQKSFKESIEERAAEMGRKPSVSEGLPPKPPAVNISAKSPVKANTSSPSKAQQSPSRAGQGSPTKTGSPTKVGSATKSLQQKLLQQAQFSKTDQLAERLRKERMAEVNALHNRYQDGILKEKPATATEQQPPSVEQTCPPPAPTITRPEAKDDRRNNIREKAREDDKACFEFSKDANTNSQQASSATKKPSIYRLVSKKCTKEEKPVVRQTSSSSMKRVSFKEHNTSTESDSSLDRQSTDQSEVEYTETDDTADFDAPSEDMVSETQESFDDDSFESHSGSSSAGSYNVPSRKINSPPKRRPQSEDDYGDDFSISAFVPDSVRRESVLPSNPQQEDSETSDDSVQYRNKPVSNTAGYPKENKYKHPSVDETSDEDDEENQGEIDDLLDEAIEDISHVEMRKKEPVAAPRKRQSYMHATTEGEMNLPSSSDPRMCMSDGLAYSVSMYRSHRSTTIQTTVNFRQLSQDDPQVKARYSRNSHYTHENVVEEDIPMPKALPPEVQKQTIRERIKELQELVSQEQSVIMQTSNALNKCCSGDSVFAGSAEQVECNRLLLVACQKRQSYLTEIQRLKETGTLEPHGSDGPKGSLTITDIRLPLKKDFVTKIGTSSDTTVHYFVILIRNGPQVIMTQMLSTHDPMMKGSLDFPNLIKIHGISSSFAINLEIYSMNVSREMYKDKKKKTPRKVKGSSLTLESPGGPTAVRTTSFTLITALPITMKALDKSSFTLDRVPFLSPLHGMIYMRLKCMMEQNVEERGFLTMFEDVSGLGSWHRRWCVITGNKLCYWKYPDDETRKDPIGLIDLKRCITEKVGLIPRDICARPHTFELVCVRPPRRGEQDTLVTKTYNTMTTTKFMLSADTKEERIVWCNKINRALANIRTWNADAMRPVKARR